MIDHSVLERYLVKVAREDAWQQRARLLQSLWRERKGLDPGRHNEMQLGSSLRIEDGGPPALAGFLSDAAKDQVTTAVDESKASGALLQRPRLWVNLLSSQPLCFNLFGPLAADLPLATETLGLVWPRIGEVTGIRFEWSPGRDDPHYTGNKSAFDVVVDYDGAGGPGFLGIEVKYHENLAGRAATDKAHYADIATRHGAFRDDALPLLRKLPLQQIWLDHLLALQLLASDRHAYVEGTFVLLSPVGNRACTAAVEKYRDCLTETRTFDARRLEEIVQALRMTTSAPWVEELHDRYFGAVPQV